MLPLLLLLSTSHAATPVTGELEVVTELPLHLGARHTLHLPGRTHWSSSVGWMPSPYLDLINAISVKAGWYNQVTADLISASLDNSVVLRNHFGWQPSAKWGFLVEGGYGVALLGGELLPAEVVAEASGQELPDDAKERPLTAAATVHQLDIQVGWRFPVAEHWLVRLDLGGAFTVASRTRIELEAPGRFASGLESAGEQYLDSTFKQYVHTPVVGLGVGYRWK